MTKPAIVRAGYPWWLRLFVHRNVAAITLGRRIYVAEEPTDAILRHEMVHVRQAGELGLPRFLWRYIAEYIRNRWRGMAHDAAYRAISFEVEAFAAENHPPV